MSLKGQFEKRVSTRVSGVVIYSFTLTNTEWFGSETFDCMLSDAARQEPRVFRGQSLKAGHAMRLDFDTVDWQWCQGDFFAVLGRKDRLDKVWQLQLREYRPGECPECHGSHRCAHCRGEGFAFDFQSGVRQCPHCGGTGECQTCAIPVREPRLDGGMASPMAGSARARRSRPPAVIQNEINDITRQINNLEWERKQREILGRNTSTSYGLHMSEIQLLSTLRTRLHTLQQELANAYRQQ